MTLDEEVQILKSVEQQSLSGNILIYKDIKVIVEGKLGKSLSDDYIWDMFKRHGWRKKMPRQSYPKADKAAQEEYKKPQELLASKALEFTDNQYSRPVKLFFQDEVRFGRIDNITSCWFPPNSRASVSNQISKRIYLYLHSRMSGNRKIIFINTSLCKSVFLWIYLCLNLLIRL
ncbi:MAG: winged helix-turn-helix domain-containing protein [Prevotellaceae bacterium]|jgi:hypothetical protein|nr:winged helix-turn-helix domain-containing protein [Prevotellaceae bacterium]